MFLSSSLLKIQFPVPPGLLMIPGIPRIVTWGARRTGIHMKTTTDKGTSTRAIHGVTRQTRHTFKPSGN